MGSTIKMNRKIVKWGNSLGIRIPNEVLQATKLKENDEVIVSVDGNCIIIGSSQAGLTKEAKIKLAAELLNDAIKD